LLCIWITLLLTPLINATSMHATPCKIISSDWLGFNLPIVLYDPSIYDYGVMVQSLKTLNVSQVRIPIHWAFLERYAEGSIEPNYLSRLDLAMEKLSLANISTLFFFSGSPTWVSSGSSDIYPPTRVQPYVTRLKWLIERYTPKGMTAVQIWNEGKDLFILVMTCPQLIFHHSGLLLKILLHIPIC